MHEGPASNWVEVHDANAFETVELDADPHRSPLPLRRHADHHAYHSGGGNSPPLSRWGRSHTIPGSPTAQYAAQARGEAGVIKQRAVFQIVRLPSKTPP